MEDTDGRLHSAVDGQSLDEDEELPAYLPALLSVPLHGRQVTNVTHLLSFELDEFLLPVHNVHEAISVKIGHVTCHHKQQWKVPVLFIGVLCPIDRSSCL